MQKLSQAALLGVLLLVLLGVEVGKAESVAVYKKISAPEVKAFMDSGEPYILIDVRTDQEFQESHIQGAILIPSTEIKNRAVSELPNTDSLIFVYCRSGRRSSMVAKELILLGYSRVYDIGGIVAWPYGTVTGSSGEKQ